MLSRTRGVAPRQLGRALVRGGAFTVAFTISFVRSLYHEFGPETSVRWRVLGWGATGLLALSLLAGPGCTERERPPRRPLAPARLAEPQQDNASANAVTAEEPVGSGVGEAFAVRIDADGGRVIFVAKDQVETPLGEILERAYDVDAAATCKMVTAWLAGNRVLDAQEVRDLLQVAWDKDKERKSHITDWDFSPDSMYCPRIPKNCASPAPKSAGYPAAWGTAHPGASARRRSALRPVPSGFAAVVTALTCRG